MKKEAIPSAAVLAILSMTSVASTASAADMENSDLASVQGSVVISNCTGAEIKAAVEAGGDVVLDCGPGPVSVSLPGATVTLPTRLRPLIPGSVTMSSGGTLFRVTNNVLFQVENLRFKPEPGFSGVGVHISNGHTVVKGSTFTDYKGFALSVHGAHLTVSGSTFDFNSSNSSFASSIYAEGGVLDISKSTFKNNSSGSSGNGGAITTFHAVATIDSSTFENNTSGRGGAIYLDGSGSAEITNCTFSGNSAGTGGAIINASNSSNVTIRNSTFSENPSSKGGPPHFGRRHAGLQ